MNIKISLDDFLFSYVLLFPFSMLIGCGEMVCLDMIIRHLNNPSINAVGAVIADPGVLVKNNQLIPLWTRSFVSSIMMFVFAIIFISVGYLTLIGIMILYSKYENWRWNRLSPEERQRWENEEEKMWWMGRNWRGS